MNSLGRLPWLRCCNRHKNSKVKPETVAIKIQERKNRLLQAVKQKDLATFNSLINDNVDIHATDNQERTALHLAAINGYT